MKKALLALAAVVVVAAVAVGTWVAIGGDDEAVARGTCDGRMTQLSVEDDGEGIEVSFELQSSAPGEAWTVVLEQGDTVLLEGERSTDEDAELDLDAFGSDGGGDEFTATATQSETGDECIATVTR